MVDDSSSDDDLYAWFIDAMAEEYGAAEEVHPNVVHVWSVVDGKKDPRPYELRVNRSQLRSVAYSHINIFDDSQGDVSVPASNPVHAGLDAFNFCTQETMDSGLSWLSRSGSPPSRTFAFDNGRMRRLNTHERS